MPSFHFPRAWRQTILEFIYLNNLFLEHYTEHHLLYNVKVFFRKKINLTSFFSSMVELFYIHYFVISTYYLPLIYIPRYILLFSLSGPLNYLKRTRGTCLIDMWVWFFFISESSLRTKKDKTIQTQLEHTQRSHHVTNSNRCWQA